jgi:glycine betaine/proline transport system permease protein
LPWQAWWRCWLWPAGRLGGWRLALLTGGWHVHRGNRPMGKGHDHRLPVRHQRRAGCLIGIPIGMYSATSDRLWAWVQAAIDTLQTLPASSI